jgi:SAM-dependent methyltransferase
MTNVAAPDAHLNKNQTLHRSVWQRKETLRLLYYDYHQRLMAACPEGRLLDIGGGTAHLKELRKDVISIDVLRFPGIDVVADAHRLPFRDSIFAGAVMLDVLHHLERPIEFLEEASRILQPGGRLAMIEPAMTPLARHFYTHFHEESVGMGVDPFQPVAINPNRNPFDSNQAIPTLMFARQTARARVEQCVPGLRVCSVDWLSLFAYPLSGGFQPWTLMPAKLTRPVVALEDSLPRIIRRQIAFRMMIVMERISP